MVLSLSHFLVDGSSGAIGHCFTRAKPANSSRSLAACASVSPVQGSLFVSLFVDFESVALRLISTSVTLNLVCTAQGHWL